MRFIAVKKRHISVKKYKGVSRFVKDIYLYVGILLIYLNDDMKAEDLIGDKR